jgi:diguanylate cyclase (GGDEF)-like protein
VLASKNASFLYQGQGRTHLLNVRYVPELKWFLCVEKTEDEALGDIRHTLMLNLVVFALVTSVILLLVGLTVNRYQKRLEEMATTDILTGLDNRRAFDLHLSQGLEEARRNKQPLSALMIDVDHFKQLNDSHGHLAGDEVLRGIAALLRTGVRQCDIACRWGGEEFVILLKNEDEDRAAIVAEKLRRTIADARFAYREQQLSVTISIGVAQCACPQDDVDHLLTRADDALYRAKAGGRNQVRRASEAG